MEHDLSESTITWNISLIDASSHYLTIVSKNQPSVFILPYRVVGRYNHFNYATTKAVIIVLAFPEFINLNETWKLYSLTKLSATIWPAAVGEPKKNLTERPGWWQHQQHKTMAMMRTEGLAINLAKFFYYLWAASQSVDQHSYFPNHLFD